MIPHPKPMVVLAQGFQADVEEERKGRLSSPGVLLKEEPQM